MTIIPWLIAVTGDESFVFIPPPPPPPPPPTFVLFLDMYEVQLICISHTTFISVLYSKELKIQNALADFSFLLSPL